jgi:8-oxo-dGTP pyrophosphatase MutT (NUDIX family)
VPISIRLRRYGYRLAHWLLRIWWFIGRPAVTGVKCVLTDGNRVLMVRHTYGHRKWDLPGGTIKRGEEPRATARREMAEELGVDLDNLRDLGSVTGRLEHRRDTMYCFGAELDSRALTIDWGEIEQVRWFSRDQLPSNLGRYVDQILAAAWRAEAG